MNDEQETNHAFARSRSNDGLGGWIDIAIHGYPDFRQHGFHTGKKVDVRMEDGTEKTAIYQGYGLFGTDNDLSMFYGATHWRPNVKVRG